MELSLSAKQTQQLSPQMIQSVEILQMNTQELLEYIDRVTQENPVIEAERPAQQDAQADELRRKLQWLEANDRQNRVYHRHDRGSDDPAANLSDSDRAERLCDYLLSQLALMDLQKEMYAAARYIVESLDQNGRLDEDIPDLARALGLTEQQAAGALQVVQSLDPAGVGARSLSECLALQLRRRGGCHATELAIVEQHLDALGKNRYAAIARDMGITQEEVRSACAVVRSLNPRPGTGFAARENLPYITPDVFVVSFADHFELLVNDAFIPTLTLSSYYCALLDESEEREVRDSLREKVRHAQWVMRSIDQRRRTLLSCVERMVEAQEQFFRTPAGRLLPLAMTDIARALEIHESTVSRAIRGKYLQCARGVYPLNYFFSRGLDTAAPGGTVSAHEAKTLLRQLIADEDPAKPLSDQKLCELMRAHDVVLSRRTVAKYRDELHLPGAAGRRRDD